MKRVSRFFSLIMTVTFLCVLSQSIYAAPVIPAQPVGYVSDYAQMLTLSEKQKLVSLLRRYSEKTSNQIFIATFKSLDGASLEHFSYEVASTWQIGQKAKDNGILLLIIKNDHKIRIEVGYGLEGDLPDAVAFNIIQKNISPYFKQQEYAVGITQGVQAIIHKISPRYQQAVGSKKSASDEAPDKTNIFVKIILFLIAIVIAITQNPVILLSLGVLYLAISILGNLILAIIHLFTKKKVTSANRWFGPHAFFRVTLSGCFWALLCFLLGFLGLSYKRGTEGGGHFAFDGGHYFGGSDSGGGGSFGGGGASGGW